MRRLVLALALGGFATTVATRSALATSPPPFPSERMVVRDCHGGDREEPMSTGGYGVGGGGLGGLGTRGQGYGGGGVGAAPPTPAPPPAAQPMPAREARAKAEAASDAAGAISFDSITPAEAPELAEESVAVGSVITKDHLQRIPTGRSYQDAVQPSAGAASAEDGDVGGAIVPWPDTRPSPGPRVQWGGTVHLSNDDSGSVASAQRLLWALERGASFTLGQIRAHELLNWFGFDQATPGPGDTFAVLPSAEQVDHDSLAVTFAVQGAAPPRPPMDLTILVDRSGSMSAEGRMAYVQRALERASGQLRPGDRVDLVLFDHEVCTPVRDLVVGRDDLGVLRREIGRMRPRGSTDLDLGLREAYRLATQHAAYGGRSHRVLTLTDAILNTGEVRPDVVTEVGRAFDQHGVRLTGVGVGHDFRDDVLDQLTEKGKGSYVFLGDARAVDRLFGRGFDGLVQSIAEDVRFALHLPPSLGLERFYGEEASRDPVDIQPVSFLAGNHQVFHQDLTVRGGRTVPTDVVTFEASWDDPVTGRRAGTSWSFPVHELLATDVHNVRKARALHAFAEVLKAQAMRQDACGAALDGWLRSRDALPGDAELAYVDGLLAKRCDVRRRPAPQPPYRPTPPVAATKVKVDADVEVFEVQLACPGGVQREYLEVGSTVASFSTLEGTCDVTLFGNVPMVARVDVPPMGRDVRCVVRGGRLECL